MPTYEYACTNCAHHVEVVQSMSDAPLTECAECGGRLRKVFSPIGIVFKGSGFYKTDSRSSNGRKGAAAATSKDSGTKESGDGAKPGAKKDTKPADAGGSSSGSSSSSGSGKSGSAQPA